MNIQNVNVAQLQAIHKPLHMARFEHNLYDEAEYVVSSAGEVSPPKRRHCVEFDGNHARVMDKPKLDWRTQKDNPDEYKHKGHFSEWGNKPLRKHEKPPTTWEPSDSESDTDSDSDTASVVLGVLKDDSEAHPIQHERERKEFWEPKQTGPAYSLGFNANKVVQSYINPPPLNRWGRPMAHPKDKVQCGVCGSIYLRSAGTQHRRSQKHIKAFNLIQVMVESQLTTRKRRYYKIPKDDKTNGNRE